MTRTIWTFPGQLSERVGMTSDGALVGSSSLERNLAVGSEVLGEDLARLCREGPERELRRDDCASVAVVTVGASAAEDLLKAGYRPEGVLGYSLGFYTAAVVSGAISLRSALRLVIAISREGDREFAGADMAMGFVTGLKIQTLEDALADDLRAGSVAVTNVNSQAQVVLAGHVAALDAALERVQPRAIRCERLAITRPYHSAWMEPVARRIGEFVSGLEICTPALPLYDHADGARLETAEAVRRRLSEQLMTRLDWRATISRLVSEGASLFVEMPPGSSTTRMVRWIARDATALALDEEADRERFRAGAGSARGGRG